MGVGNWQHCGNHLEIRNVFTYELQFRKASKFRWAYFCKVHPNQLLVLIDWKCHLSNICIIFFVIIAIIRISVMVIALIIIMVLRPCYAEVYHHCHNQNCHDDHCPDNYHGKTLLCWSLSEFFSPDQFFPQQLAPPGFKKVLLMWW